MGIEVLKNRGKVIAPGDGGGFALLGVDDLWAKEAIRGQGPDLALAQSMVPPDRATVLLAHQPRFVRTAAAAKIDLQLSGHTHGGQINPGFRPADLFMSYVAGRYDVGASQLYVNRGFGTAGPPRAWAPPPKSRRSFWSRAEARSVALRSAVKSARGSRPRRECAPSNCSPGTEPARKGPARCAKSAKSPRGRRRRR